MLEHVVWICVFVCASLHLFQNKLCVCFYISGCLCLRLRVRVRVRVLRFGEHRLPCMLGFYRDCLMKWHVIHSESADTNTDTHFHTHSSISLLVCVSHYFCL